LKILQIVLVPATLRDGSLKYSTERPSVVVVTNQFVHKFAGLTDVGEAIIANPAIFADRGAGIQKYAASKLAHSEDSLSLKDLSDLAEDIELQTAFRYPSLVGDHIESSVISGGKIQSFEPYLSREPGKFDLAFDFLDRAWVDGVDNFTRTGNEKVVIIVMGSLFSNCAVELDGRIFTNTRFQNCLLHYSGSPISFFDTNNQIVNCRLHIDPGVAKDAFFVSAS